MQTPTRSPLRTNQNAARPSRTRPSRKRRVPISTLLLHSILIFFCLIILLPLAWLLLLSVESIQDAARGALWPQRFDFGHYLFVFQHFHLLAQNFSSTIIITTSTVVLTTVCAVLGGYALVHLRLPGRALVLAVMVATLFIPDRLVSLIAIWGMEKQLHLFNTLPGVILPCVAFNIVVCILIMRGVFQQISPEIVDAARIDGSSSWRTLWAVALPMALNGVVVVAISSFVVAWGEYLLAVTLLDDTSLQPMLVAFIGALGGMGELDAPRVAALYLLFILPGIVIFAILQRWFMKGLMEGALNTSS